MCNMDWREATRALRQSALTAVDCGIELRIVVHLELAVDLEIALAARAFPEQPLQAGRQIGALLVQARQFRAASVDVRGIHVAAL